MPAGVLTGALAGMGLGKVAMGLPPVPAPPEANAVLQVMVGIMVGLRMSRGAIRSGVRSLAPAVLVSAAMIAVGVAAALVAARLTSLDPVTALFAAAPGGLTEIVVVSAAFGADGAAVAAVHLARLLTAIAGINLLLAYLNRKESGTRRSAPPLWSESRGDWRRLGLATAAGAAGGTAGLLISIPAGGVIGALAGSAAFRLLTENPVPVRQYGLGVQLLGGMVIGLGLSAEFFAELVSLAGAGAILISAQMLLWISMSLLLARLFGQDNLTAAFAAAPGGMGEVIATASSAGANTVVVAFIHLVRLSTIIVVVPALISLFPN
ncbi:hypothetical protein E0L93_06620 [Rubrobacter taiwanensis]|uniref:AbrB family transcriptional regulator n=1 Tax=Rubrobacter taiwanensis TaxID=185139 RepID=A0A4R1BL74_9ACTN|nr:hypothetical protein E0L93_06620 [Rubrobacter taiwanensis]